MQFLQFCFFICFLLKAALFAEMLNMPKRFDFEITKILAIGIDEGLAAIEMENGLKLVSCKKLEEPKTINWKPQDSVKVFRSLQGKNQICAIRNLRLNDVVFFKNPDYLLKPPTVRSMQIIGERCSGTTFLLYVFHHNFWRVCSSNKYGWKHFPHWFCLKADDASWKEEESVLTIVIVRNIYDWLSSFSQARHHVPIEMPVSFSGYIRARWWMHPQIIHGILTEERDPLTGELFKNIIKMRSAKLKDWKLLCQMKNVYFINYETLRDFPEAAIAEIAEKFSLDFTSPVFTEIEKFQGKGETYQPKVYPKISKLDLRYIQSQMDIDLEKEWGYNSPYASLKD